MRLIAELLIVAALIALGWSKSFSERVGLSREESLPPRAVPTKAPAARATAPADGAAAAAPATEVTTKSSPTPSGAWMWDPNRQGSLDRKTSPQPRRR